MQNGKAKIEKSTNSLNIIIPSKKNRFAQFFASVWMAVWIISLPIMLLFLIISVSGQTFIPIIFIFWISGGIYTFSVLMWSLFGQERFIIDKNQILFEKTVWGIGLKKRFEKSSIKNIRARIEKEHWFFGHRMESYGLEPGKILFNSGSKKYSFGLALKNEEAIIILKLLKEEFKIEGNLTH